MSYYRIYHYPLHEQPFKHLYFRGRRSVGVSVPREDFRHNDVKIDHNLVRARSTVRSLILCNYFDYFCTFTFNGRKFDRYDLMECKRRLLDLFRNYRERYSPEFRYLVIPEFHKDGAVHFHGMVKGIRDEDFIVPKMIWKRDAKTDELYQVPNTPGYVDWSYYSKKFGWFSCSRVRDHVKCANYVTKYITKDLQNLPPGFHVFMSSKDLARPELVFDSDDIPLSFKPQWQDEHIAMAYMSEDWTFLNGLLNPWFGECCSDLKDDPADLDDYLHTQVCVPLTGEQLSFS